MPFGYRHPNCHWLAPTVIMYSLHDALVNLAPTLTESRQLLGMNTLQIFVPFSLAFALLPATIALFSAAPLFFSFSTPALAAIPMLATKKTPTRVTTAPTRYLRETILILLRMTRPRGFAGRCNNLSLRRTR